MASTYRLWKDPADGGWKSGRPKPGATVRWYAAIRDKGGKWKRVLTRQLTKAAALRWALDREAEIARTGLSFDELEASKRPQERETFEAFADYWLKHHSAVACTSHHDNVGRAKHLKAELGKLSLGEITAEKVSELRARMAGETVKDRETGEQRPRWAHATVNRTLALLRKMLNDAVTWGRIPQAPKVKLLPVPDQGFAYLKQDEAERLLSWTRANAPNDYPLYAAAIYTGARMGELYGLRWQYVDLDRPGKDGKPRGVITIRASYDQPYTKSKKIRHVPTGAELRLLLKAWRQVCPQGELGLVFPKPDGTMRRREVPPLDFKAHLEAARCPAITFHDLRHTAASLMVMSGVSLRSVQQILGHSTIQVTEKYAHLAPDFLEREADRVSLAVQDGLGVVLPFDAAAGGED